MTAVPQAGAARRRLLRPWTGVATLGLLSAVAVAATASTGLAGVLGCWAVLGAVAGFAVSGST